MRERERFLCVWEGERKGDEERERKKEGERGYKRNTK